MAEGDPDPGEDRFFKSKPREDSFVGHVGPPPPLWPKIVIGVVIAIGIAGMVIWQYRSPSEGTVWIHHPGPGIATVEIEGEPHELKPGKMLDRQVRLGTPVELKVTRAGEQKQIQVEPKDDKGEVAIVDLGGDAAYVVLDVSAHYADGEAPSSLPLLHVSPPADLHRLPFPSLRLVRPGRALPEKDSWELQAVRSPNQKLEMFKVFRVDPKRLENKEQLVQVLSEGVNADHAADYENLMVPVRTSTKPSGSIIPPAGS